MSMFRVKLFQEQVQNSFVFLEKKYDFSVNEADVKYVVTLVSLHIAKNMAYHALENHAGKIENNR